VGFFSDDPELAADSLEALRRRAEELGVDHLAFGHSGPLPGSAL